MVFTNYFEPIRHVILLNIFGLLPSLRWKKFYKIGFNNSPPIFNTPQSLKLRNAKLFSSPLNLKFQQIKNNLCNFITTHIKPKTWFAIILIVNEKCTNTTFHNLELAIKSFSSLVFDVKNKVRYYKLCSKSSWS